ncbi:MAG: slipin family protein [Polyangiales bacterium]
MLTTVVLGPSQRALVLRDGVPFRWLRAGRHRLWGRRDRFELRRYELDQHTAPMTPELLAVLPGDEGVEHVVGAAEIGLVTADGRPAKVLTAGRWVLWQSRVEVTCENVSTAALSASAVPTAFRALAPDTELRTIVAAPYERVLLYVDGALAEVLGAGPHPVFVRDRELRDERVDLREREMQIVGQDVMTADKVTLRLNLCVKLRVTDAVKACEAVENLDNAVYTEAQLCARRSLAGLTLDQLLERRGTLGAAMREEVAARAAGWGVEMLAVDVKDVVLPGEMKTLLNQVIEADKRAAANVILRREETAATRALANTAKLLESNPTLLRLKELEAWKEIAQSVGQVNVVATPQQLLGPLSLPAPPSK